MSPATHSFVVTAQPHAKPVRSVSPESAHAHLGSSSVMVCVSILVSTPNTVVNVVAPVVPALSVRQVPVSRPARRPHLRLVMAAVSILSVIDFTVVSVG